MADYQTSDMLSDAVLALFVGGCVSVTLIMFIVGLQNTIKEYFKKRKKQ